MPHDLNNFVLQPGDKVVIHAVVTQITTGEDYCNVTLETEHGRRPDGQKEIISAINSRVVEKV